MNRFIKIRSSFEGTSCFLSFMLFILFSCGAVSKIPRSNNARIIEGIPFYPQEAYQCGPASLAGVLSFYGLKMTTAEISAEIFSREARGTLDMDMIFYAQKKGLDATQYTGSWRDLERNVDSSHPLIVLVDEGFWVYQRDHFMVVVGYDEKHLIVNSGKERHAFIPRDDFLRSWKRTQYWTLRISPK